MGKWARIKPACSCGRPALERKARCADCDRDHRRNSMRARRDAHRREGRCVHCSSPALPNASMCQPCGRKQALGWREKHPGRRELIGAKYHPDAPKKLAAYATEHYAGMTPEAEAWILAHADEWREKSDKALWEHLQVSIDSDWTPSQPFWDRHGHRIVFEDYVIDRIDFARSYKQEQLRLESLYATAGGLL